MYLIAFVSKEGIQIVEDEKGYVITYKGLVEAKKEIETLHKRCIVLECKAHLPSDPLSEDTKALEHIKNKKEKKK